MKTIDMYDFLADIGEEPNTVEPSDIANLFFAYIKNPENRMQYSLWVLENTF